MKKILELIDRYLCRFFGFEKQEVKPDVLKKIGNKILIVNTESHKRHTYSQNLDQFLSKNIEKLDDSVKEKLGISFGKALAKNLIISFEKIAIKEDKNHA